MSYRVVKHQALQLEDHETEEEESIDRQEGVFERLLWDDRRIGELQEVMYPMDNVVIAMTGSRCGG